jgi:digeranylgeranylglycerophospholipid reductase
MKSEVKRVVMENSKARSVIYEQKGETKEINFKVLIGADGVGSVVSKQVGFSTEGYELIPTIQYVMVNCNIPEANMIRIYMGNEVAPLGYAWVFAKNEYMANVGIGVRGKPAKVYLDKFVSNHPEFFKNATIVKEGGGGVPVGGQLKEVIKDNVLLCGDSSGQVIPITGGGIRTSLAAGSIAGEAITESLQSKDLSLLEKYPASYNEYWGSRIKQSLRVVKALEKLNDDDLNLLGTLINGDDVVDLANGLNVKRVVSKLMRHPVAAVRIASIFL